MWSPRTLGAALPAILLLALTACDQGPKKPVAPRGPSEASQKWQKTANSFVEDYMTNQPQFAALAGRHEFDGKLPDLSSHGIKREIARLHDQRNQLSGVDPKTLEPRERFDRDYLIAVVDRDLFWLE